MGDKAVGWGKTQAEKRKGAGGGSEHSKAGPWGAGSSQGLEMLEGLPRKWGSPPGASGPAWEGPEQGKHREEPNDPGVACGRAGRLNLQRRPPEEPKGVWPLRPGLWVGTASTEPVLGLGVGGARASWGPGGPRESEQQPLC